MPNPAHSGIHGDPWHFCDRCGCPYHVSQLAWQEGMLLCTVPPGNCFDTQTARQRDLEIARILDEVTMEPDAQLDPHLINPQDTNEEV
jgi:hypothetical protein